MASEQVVIVSVQLSHACFYNYIFYFAVFADSIDLLVCHSPDSARSCVNEELNNLMMLVLSYVGASF